MRYGVAVRNRPTFGRAGYVALFEIEDASNVVVVALRHQLEDDYH